MIVETCPYCQGRGYKTRYGNRIECLICGGDGRIVMNAVVEPEPQAVAADPLLASGCTRVIGYMFLGIIFVLLVRILL